MLLANTLHLINFGVITPNLMMLSTKVVCTPCSEGDVYRKLTTKMAPSLTINTCLGDAGQALVNMKTVDKTPEDMSCWEAPLNRQCLTSYQYH